jgi:hypothetical protein
MSPLEDAHDAVAARRRPDRVVRAGQRAPSNFAERNGLGHLTRCCGGGGCGRGARGFPFGAGCATQSCPTAHPRQSAATAIRSLHHHESSPRWPRAIQSYLVRPPKPAAALTAAAAIRRRSVCAAGGRLLTPEERPDRSLSVRVCSICPPRVAAPPVAQQMRRRGPSTLVGGPCSRGRPGPTHRACLATRARATRLGQRASYQQP